jgi:hypothetical protein
VSGGPHALGRVVTAVPLGEPMTAGESSLPTTVAEVDLDGVSLFGETVRRPCGDAFVYDLRFTRTPA